MFGGLGRLRAWLRNRARARRDATSEDARDRVERQKEDTMIRRIGFGALAYLVPTFALGFVWHLVAFKAHYDALAIFRQDVIIPFGFAAITLQAVLFASVFARAAAHEVSLLRRGLSFAAFGAVLSWSFTTLSVAAKNVMSSVPDYLLIESAFTIVQWTIVGPLMALAFEKANGRVTVRSPAAPDGASSQVQTPS